MARSALDPADSKAVLALLKVARAEGIVAGLEMAAKFATLTGSKKDLAAMIKAAIASTKG